MLGEGISLGDSKLFVEASSAGASGRGETPGGIVAQGVSSPVKVEAADVMVSSGVSRRPAVEFSIGAEPALWTLRCVQRF